VNGIIMALIVQKILLMILNTLMRKVPRIKKHLPEDE
jgi:hypothetical protein